MSKKVIDTGAATAALIAWRSYSKQGFSDVAAMKKALRDYEQYQADKAMKNSISKIYGDI